MLHKKNISYPICKSSKTKGITTKAIILEFLYNRFSTNLNELVEIQKEIRNFKSKNPRDKNQKRVLVFFLGACVHWVGFIVYRHKNKFEYTLFDSENHDMMFLNEEEMRENIKRRTKKNNWNAWKVKINKQMIYDYQTLLSLLVNSFNKEPMFLDHMLYNDIFKILPLFLNHPEIVKFRQRNPKYEFKTDYYFEELSQKNLKDNTTLEKDRGNKGSRTSFAINKNPAATSFVEGKYLDLNKEVYSNLRTLNKNISRYQNYFEDLSSAAKKHYLQAQHDVKILNQVFKFRNKRWRLRR